MKKGLLLAAIMPLQACVGVNVVHLEETHTIGMAPSQSPRTVYQASSSNNQRVATKQDVLSTWGEPESKGTTNDLDKWVYRGGLKWRGVVLWMLIPIPLVIPTGYGDVTLYFEGDTVLKATSQFHDLTYCGFVITELFYCGPADEIHIMPMPT